MEATSAPKYEIHYLKPMFHRRVFANLVDIIIFGFAFVGLFLGLRAIVTHHPSYVAKEEEFVGMMLDSGLYKTLDGRQVDVVSYYATKQTDYTGTQKKKGAIEAIDTFYAFASSRVEAVTYQNMLLSYDEYRLQSTLVYEGITYFVKSGEDIIENPLCAANDETYFSSAYAPFIDNYLQSYLVSRIPGYHDLARFESRCLIWIELAPSYLIAGLLVYVIPPLCFRRSRYTLGKALYRIGLADSRLLSVTYPRILARIAIFYFAELVLSLFTFGVPYLISFSLMAFSKNKQGFPDYILGLNEVDLSKEKLYKSYDEIRLQGVSGAKEPIDFHMIQRD